MTRDLPPLRANRDFVRYWIASSTSNFGSSLSLIAYPLLVLSMLGPGHIAEVGVVGTVAALSRLAFRLPGGHFADRYDRRRVMLLMDLARLVAVGSVPLAALVGVLSYPHLLVVAVVEGVATSFFGPAASIAFRDVVGTEQLTTAMGRMQASYAVISMTGPTVGASLFSVHQILPFAIDAASYAVSAVLLLGLRVTPPAPVATGPRDNRVTAGLRWLWANPAVTRVMIFASVVNFVGAGTQVALLVTLHDQRVPGPILGLVMAGAGAGIVLGSLAAPRIIAALSAAGLYALVGLVWTGGMTVFAALPSPWVLGPLLVLMMLVAPAAGILFGKMVLGAAPRELLGRISTAQALVAQGLAAFGPVVATWLLAGLGGRLSWLVLAAVCASATAFVVRPGSRTTASGAATPEPALAGVRD